MARFYPPTIPHLREKLERSEDPAKTALDIHELVEQHGTHGWVDALIEKAGPTVQLQLEDLGDLLEIVKKCACTLNLSTGRVSQVTEFVCYPTRFTDFALTAFMSGATHAERQQL